MPLLAAALSMAVAPASAPNKPPSPARTLSLPLGIVWQVAFVSPPSAPGTSDDEQVYVPLRTGEFVALAAADGAVRWWQTLPTVLKPAASNGLVFLVRDHDLIALDRTSGEVKWQDALPDAATTAPTVNGDLITIGVAPGALLAFAPDGRQLWRAELGSPVYVPVASDAGRLFASLEDGRLVEIDPHNGSTGWTHRFAERAAPPFAENDRVYVGSRDNFFYCLTADSGKEKWRWRTGADIVTAGTADDRHVYFVSLDNQVRALNRGNGNLEWSHTTVSRPVGSPVVLGSSVVVTAMSPTIKAYVVEDGKDAGDLPAPGQPSATPMFVEGRGERPPLLLVLTAGGQMAAFGRTADPPFKMLDFLPGRPWRPATGAQSPTGAPTPPRGRDRSAF